METFDRANTSDEGRVPPRDRGNAAEEPGAPRSASAPSDHNAAPVARPEPKTPRRAPKIVIALILIPLIGYGAFEGYRSWLASQHFETTDDAFVDGHISQVASQVSGRVEAILVRDNQDVSAGQILLQIDPRDYAVRLKQMEAQRANAIAQVEQAKAQLELQQATVEQSDANIRAAEADALQAKQDYGRYSTAIPQAVTRQEVDRSNANAKSTAAKVDAAKHGLAAAKAQVEAIKAQIAAARAMVDQTDAQVENARLQTTYTQILAPVAGRVTKRSVEVGNYINPGQALLSVVPDDVWVTANFKETQLADMRPGQKVDIHLDAFPRTTFPGHVDSFQTGTGSAFSSLPAENATGNYVKVVQRLPVKIVFDTMPDDRFRMAPGLSVQPKVTVR